MPGAATRYVHRWAYEYFVGPIPKGMHLDHLCRNRRCFRPSHLEPVSPRTNLLRSPLTRASINAAKTHCAKGHEYAPGSYYIEGRRRVCKACRKAKDRKRYLRKKAAA